MDYREHRNLELQRREAIKRQREKAYRNRLIVLQSLIFIVIAAAVFSLIFVPGNGSLIGMAESHPAVLSADKAVSAVNRLDYKFLIKDIENVSSSNAILIDLLSGEIMAEKKPDEKIYPASLTKMMTAIIVLEHYNSLEDTLVIPSEIYTYIYEQNASVAGYNPGEKARIIDLLYGVLLPSGADACLTLASAVAGNEQAFAQMMTEKAHSIGAVNTNFANSTGLHDPNHYSTVRDVSIILTYALKNETFKTIFTTEKYTTEPTNKHPYGLTFNNTTFSAFDRAGITNSFVKGGKTGYTGEACLCLATYAMKSGREYILVTVGAGTPQSSRGTHHVVDADYIYRNYT